MFVHRKLNIIWAFHSSSVFDNSSKVSFLFQTVFPYTFNTYWRPPQKWLTFSIFLRKTSESIQIWQTDLSIVIINNFLSASKTEKRHSIIKEWRMMIYTVWTLHGLDTGEIDFNILISCRLNLPIIVKLEEKKNERRRLKFGHLTFQNFLNCFKSSNSI